MSISKRSNPRDQMSSCSSAVGSLSVDEVVGVLEIPLTNGNGTEDGRESLGEVEAILSGDDSKIND